MPLVLEADLKTIPHSLKSETISQFIDKHSMQRSMVKSALDNSLTIQEQAKDSKIQN